MSVRKIGKINCHTCNGTGKLEYPLGLHPGAPDKCYDCEGYGYRIVVKNEHGVERHVKKEHFDLGISESYF